MQSKDLWFSVRPMIDEIAKTGNKMTSYQEAMAQLGNQADILKDALSMPDHPLVAMQDK